MPFILDFSRFSVTQRRKNEGLNAIPNGSSYMFALGCENGPKFGLADETYIEDGQTYKELLGWRAGDYARISQDAVTLDDNAIKFDTIIQAPDKLPPGFSWMFQVLVSNGVTETEIFSRKLTTRKKRLTVFLPASEITGQTLIFQLQLLGA